MELSLGIKKQFKLKESIRESFKRNGMNFLISILISLIIIIICSYFKKDFFFWDDAQNEILPFYKAMGKIWLKGEIPFIINDTFIGQNQMIDMQRGPFLPQTILMSILATKMTFVKSARVVGFINIVIITFFAQKIIEALSIDKKYKIIIALLFTINPIFLYISLSSWWNSAAAQGWFVAALSSILLLRKKFEIKYLILNIVSVLSIFASGFPQTVILYIFVALVYLIEMFCSKEYHKIIIFVLISIGILFIAINIYSEYMLSSNMLERYSAIDNNGNFLKPMFNQIVMTFTPVYYSFMHRYGGFLFTGISIGYSSLYILIFICFAKNFKEIFKYKNTKFLITLLVIFFIFTQTPEQLGPTRHPFRYLSYFSEVLVIFSIYGLSKSELIFSKMRIKIFFLILVVSSILAVFNVESNYKQIVVLNILFLVFTLIYICYIIKYNKLQTKLSVVYYIFMLLLMLFMENSPLFFLSHQKLKTSIGKENINNSGYLLSLANLGGADDKNKEVEDLYAAQFLLYGVKAVNGYSPVGHKSLSELIVKIDSVYRTLDPLKTVINLSQKYDNKCYFDLLNINFVTILKDNINENPEISTSLKNCGYIEKNSKLDYVTNYTKDLNNIGNISYSSPGINVKKVLENKSNEEKYLISSTKSGNIIMSKVYWPGYSAYINNKKINVSDEKGLIKLDGIPKDLNNAILELRYFPKSWRITLWLALIGIIEIILTLIYLRKSNKKDIYTESS